MQLAIGCPWVSLKNSLHVLLVFVVPRSANCDSLMEKSHICNYVLGFPRLASNVEILVLPNNSERYFWSFRGVSCLANNSPFHFR